MVLRENIHIHTRSHIVLRSQSPFFWSLGESHIRLTHGFRGKKFWFVENTHTHTHDLFFHVLVFFSHTHTPRSLFIVSYRHKQKARLMAIGDGSQNAPIATNAPISHFVHWMGCISSFDIKWDHHNPFLFVVDHCTLFFFFFCS
jgi:hypothetical protein